MLTYAELHSKYCRFISGDKVKIIRGTHVGNIGKVIYTGLNGVRVKVCVSDSVFYKTYKYYDLDHVHDNEDYGIFIGDEVEYRYDNEFYVGKVISICDGYIHIDNPNISFDFNVPFCKKTNTLIINDHEVKVNNDKSISFHDEIISAEDVQRIISMVQNAK